MRSRQTGGGGAVSHSMSGLEANLTAFKLVVTILDRSYRESFRGGKTLCSVRST